MEREKNWRSKISLDCPGNSEKDLFLLRLIVRTEPDEKYGTAPTQILSIVKLRRIVDVDYFFSFKP